MGCKVLNLRFNRVENDSNHKYINLLGDNEIQKNIMNKGFIKCKLMHGEVGTIIVPDILIYQVNDKNQFKWIQPLAFRANQIYFLDDDAQGNIMIDISSQTSVTVRFWKSKFVKLLSDYSQLYECEIYSSVDILGHSTGEGYFDEKQIPFLKAYHHTNQKAYSLINECQYLKLSSWNIAGNKELANIGYLYVTPINQIMYDTDLEQIAMSSKGEIYARTYFGSIRKIKVYRRFVKDFTAKLTLWIDSQIIAPSHLYKMVDSVGVVYYQICSPFIQRIGAYPNSQLTFLYDKISDNKEIKKADYIILGNLNTFKGIEAPYDEENTKYVFKIEKISKEDNLFDFWEKNANTDQFSDKSAEFLQFKKNHK